MFKKMKEERFGTRQRGVCEGEMEHKQGSIGGERKEQQRAGGGA